MLSTTHANPSLDKIKWEMILLLFGKSPGTLEFVLPGSPGEEIRVKKEKNELDNRSCGNIDHIIQECLNCSA